MGCLFGIILTEIARDPKTELFSVAKLALQDCQRMADNSASGGRKARIEPLTGRFAKF